MSPLAELMNILALRAAQAGQGGLPALLARGYSRGGGLDSLKQRQTKRLVQGEGGGQDDIVPAMLAPGEYVFDAETVAALGDGSNEEGARRLDELRERIRAQKRAAPISKIPPKAKRPEAYLRGTK